MAVRLSYVNLFARDIDALAAFYSRLLGFPEIVAHRSPIYRCLDAGGGMELGFNAVDAYRLLNLQDRQTADAVPVSVYFTVELDAAGAVDALADECAASGGRIVKAPYLTYYNARQAVLADPEENIFRLNHRIGPRTPYDDLPSEKRPIKS